MNIISENIKTLFLDIGGVLLTSGWDRTSRKSDFARICREGCIIRASVLEDIMAAVTEQPGLPNPEWNKKQH